MPFFLYLLVLLITATARAGPLVVGKQTPLWSEVELSRELSFRDMTIEVASEKLSPHPPGIRVLNPANHTLVMDERALSPISADDEDYCFITKDAAEQLELQVVGICTVVHGNRSP
jgi:hypothetical protein